jgi:catechol 2,3-dioxygenase-like lactoylglutathione lyase family enzyme
MIYGSNATVYVSNMDNAIRFYTEVVGLTSEAGNYINFVDPDGNPIYVGDWDPDFDALPGESLEDRLSRQEQAMRLANWIASGRCSRRRLRWIWRR